jgi:hypothetical protein
LHMVGNLLQVKLCEAFFNTQIIRLIVTLDQKIWECWTWSGKRL